MALSGRDVLSLPIGTFVDEFQNLSPEEIISRVDVMKLRQMIVIFQLHKPRTPAIVARAQRGEQLAARRHTVPLVVLGHHEHRRHRAVGHLVDHRP